MSRNERPLSSRELLNRIGLNEETPNSLLLNESLDDLLGDLEGDLGSVLLERYALLNQPQAFKPGDLVCWKPGLKNRRVPAYGAPAVVLEVLDQPITDGETESGSTYFREPLSLVLGLFWDRDQGRGDFVAFHFDGRRFEAWNTKTA
ncbi:hypothetical protein CKO42_08475 [Lamprobacter modestohalophilus]|uniref:Uncharacterized protein n=1 Tax=Lamprobacter modestohalophilus TaxID=1064514 RepID=A0A9X0W7V1_9GAMM|nr:hypothetical protein [Lamprobacter modestohalophilus]MBK1618471.1 hypothetical protein [Lamprobacter modestohalophilus]